MAAKKAAKRLGKKHRQASTRPHKGKAPKATPTTGAVDPRKRKITATKQAEAAAKKRVSKRSPEFEAKRTIAGDGVEKTARGKVARVDAAAGNAGPGNAGAGPTHRSGAAMNGARTSAKGAGAGPGPKSDEQIAEEKAWRAAELAALQQSVATETAETAALPLIAICGRPNVGKSTLFNRVTGSRRSIVGDEPGITRDRIYGEMEWQNRRARLVDTGGVVPDDEALIPSEIFRQAQLALREADAVVMVVDGRSELASPDMELARLLLRCGKPLFLAVNKMEAESLHAGAENFRRLGFKNVVPVSAEHGTGIGDLLDEVFAVLPEGYDAEAEADPSASLRDDNKREQRDDNKGSRRDDNKGPRRDDNTKALQDGENGAVESSSNGETAGPPPAAKDDSVFAGDENEAPAGKRPRLFKSHGEYEERETRVAIIGRPNVGKSTLLNALTGEERAIVSPIAGTTRDAVDEIVERKGHVFRFVDTAGIRRKGKTKMMAEKLSVIMARKHLEAADVSLLVIDAAEGVTGIDANIGGYAHESGRSVVIVINKWDLVAPAKGSVRADGKAPADQKVFEQQVRDALKYLDYAPLVFITASEGKGLDGLFSKIELVARERRKRVSTGQMNKFLERVDFQKASVPMNRRMRIYYMTQAQVAPPTFVLFTDRDVKMHFAFERFLANQIRDSFGFIGSPIWFKTRPRNKKKVEE